MDTDTPPGSAATPPPAGPTKVKLGKREVFVYDVAGLDMTTREDLWFAWMEALPKGVGPQRRVWAAAVGLLTRIGRDAKVAYQGDVVAYGGAVWRHLVDVEKASIPEVAKAGGFLLGKAAQGIFPREEEIEAVRKNSEGGTGT
ncbi:MAG TPA: hypothetical protein VEA41_03850 [Salinarimonas sp.]|nr:hypothetical protein [Salinarimonas sp.]